MRTRLALFTLAASLAVPDAHTTPATVSTPSAVALSFYRGYVARFRSDHDPLLDLVLEGSPLVSTSLMTDLRARLDDDADPNDDYFLHSPHGVRPCHSVAVQMLRVTTDDASALVTLGARHTPPWQVAVSLARDAGLWRIRSVAPHHALPTSKAAAKAIADC